MLDVSQSLVLASIPDDGCDSESYYTTSQLESLPQDSVIESLDNMDWTPLDVGDDSGRVDDSFASHDSRQKPVSISDSRIPSALRSPRPLLLHSQSTLGSAPRAADNRLAPRSSVAVRDGRAPAATLGVGPEPRPRMEAKGSAGDAVSAPRGLPPRPDARALEEAKMRLGSSKVVAIGARCSMLFSLSFYVAAGSSLVDPRPRSSAASDSDWFRATAPAIAEAETV
jgi:hypothetical protein